MPSATSLSPRQVKPRGLSPLNHWQNTLTHCILSSKNTLYWSSSLNILPSESRHGGFSHDLNRMHMGRRRGFPKRFEDLALSKALHKALWNAKRVELALQGTKRVVYIWLYMSVFCLWQLDPLQLPVIFLYNVSSQGITSFHGLQAAGVPWDSGAIVTTKEIVERAELTLCLTNLRVLVSPAKSVCLLAALSCRGGRKDGREVDGPGRTFLRFHHGIVILWHLKGVIFTQVPMPSPPPHSPNRLWWLSSRLPKDAAPTVRSGLPVTASGRCFLFPSSFPSSRHTVVDASVFTRRDFFDLVSMARPPYFLCVFVAFPRFLWGPLFAWLLDC